MTMTANLVALTRTTPFLYRFVGVGSCFGKPIRHSIMIPAHSPSYALNFCNGIVFRQLRLSPKAVSDDGFNGGDGNNHGRGGGGKGDDSNGGENNWSFLSWYLDLLAKYPVLIKALTSAILTLIGDVICQLVIDQVPCLDLKRTFLFTLLGLVLVGPTLHFWYLYLSKLVVFPGASGAFMSLLLDQFLFSPMFIGVFLSALMTLEGRPSQVIPKLQHVELEESGFLLCLLIGNCGYLSNFLTFGLYRSNSRFLLLMLLLWYGMLSSHKQILQK